MLYLENFMKRQSDSEILTSEMNLTNSPTDPSLLGSDVFSKFFEGFQRLEYLFNYAIVSLNWNKKVQPLLDKRLVFFFK